MRQHAKLLLAAVVATALMALAVGSAAARQLEVNEERYRITWRTLEFKEGVFGIAVRCPVTLEGSFHSRTITKNLGSLIGYVTRAIVKENSCQNGRGIPATETLPWHVTYEGFTGTLPEITNLIVLLRNATFRLSEIPFHANCTATVDNINGTIETGVREAGGFWKPDNLTPDNRKRIVCGEITGTFEGTGRVTRSASTTRILLRLI
jgi:hypothetical protein